MAKNKYVSEGTVGSKMVVETDGSFVPITDFEITTDVADALEFTMGLQSSATGSIDGAYFKMLAAQLDLGIGLTSVIEITATGVSVKQPIAMNSKKITGLAEATTNGDAVRFEQLTTTSDIKTKISPISCYYRGAGISLETSTTYPCLILSPTASSSEDNKIFFNAVAGTTITSVKITLRARQNYTGQNTVFEAKIFRSTISLGSAYTKSETQIGSTYQLVGTPVYTTTIVASFTGLTETVAMTNSYCIELYFNGGSVPSNSFSILEIEVTTSI